MWSQIKRVFCRSRVRGKGHSSKKTTKKKLTQSTFNSKKVKDCDVGPQVVPAKRKEKKKLEEKENVVRLQVVWIRWVFFRGPFRRLRQ
jgi:hypothetical protein